MSRSIDLNADLGEGFPWDESLLTVISSASVCCGAHAGDDEAIRNTLTAARRNDVNVGAHPGYPDRVGFGRRECPATAREVERLIRDQVGLLEDLAAAEDVTIQFLKPHGALYNQAQRDPEIAAGVLAAAKALKLPVLGQPRSRFAELAQAADVRMIAEGFADRRYEADGRLVPRSEPGAILVDHAEIARQVLDLVKLGFETICLHGDNSDAVALAGLVRTTLHTAGISVYRFPT